MPTEIIVAEDSHKSRLDKFLTKVLCDIPEVSRSQIAQMIKGEKILINDNPVKKNGQIILKGDRITFSTDAFQNSTQHNLVPNKMNLEIVYEDAHIIVINKPFNMTVHPGAATTPGTTLVEGVLYHCQLAEIDSANAANKNSAVQLPELRPGVVHRLDKDTTGLIVFAKDLISHRNLAEQFKSKKSGRKYLTLVYGTMDKETTVSNFLIRSPANRLKFTVDKISPSSGKYAETKLIPKESFFDKISLIEAQLATGRTHQIRVHCEFINTPILGDQLYGFNQSLSTQIPLTIRRSIAKLRRQLLHAHELIIIHPRSNKSMRFLADLPDDFQSLLQELRSI